MSEFIARVVGRLRWEAGQALAEYGLILALIAVVSIVALTAIGLAVSDRLQQVAECRI